MSSTLGLRNPLRYRGYVYDIETKLYYLQSRYYNPEWGRFLNADSMMPGLTDTFGKMINAFFGGIDDAMTYMLIMGTE